MSAKIYYISLFSHSWLSQVIKLRHKFCFPVPLSHCNDLHFLFASLA